MSSESEDDFLSADEGGSEAESDCGSSDCEKDSNVKDIKIENNAESCVKENNRPNSCELSIEKRGDQIFHEHVMPLSDSVQEGEPKSLRTINTRPTLASTEINEITTQQFDAQSISIEKIVRSLPIQEKDKLKADNSVITATNFKEDDIDNFHKPNDNSIEKVQKLHGQLQVDKLEKLKEAQRDNKLQSTCISTTTLESSGSNKEIKESKIGRKKPRERLSERLGNKKLGARLTKPLVGICSDVIQQKHESGEGEQSTTHVIKGENRPGGLEHQEKAPKSPENKIYEHQNIGDDSAAPQWGLTWGDWGSSLMTAATSLSKEVSQGVGTVLKTVEVGLGAPSPSELAKEVVEREKTLKKMEEIATKEDDGKDLSNFAFGFGSIGSLVSGVSGAFETAGNKVLLGSLDTLERIGRRTMDIIQDGDPGLRRKRAFLNANKQNLSSVLREARERAIEREEGSSHYDSEMDKCRVSVGLVWDNTEGPAHLEALSLIAKQCQGNTWNILQNIPVAYRHETEQKVQDIIKLSTIEETDRVDNIHKALMDVTRDVQLPLQFNKMITGWPALRDALSKLSIEICGLGSIDLELKTVQTDLYEQVCRYVAVVAALAHKAAELALITPELDCLKLARQFQQLCGCISGGLETSADDVCESLSKTLMASDPNFNDTITNIYVQMAEVNSYLEKSLIDLIAVIAHVEVKKTSDEL